jgi:hypothetical protein
MLTARDEDIEGFSDCETNVELDKPEGEGKDFVAVSYS